MSKPCYIRLADELEEQVRQGALQVGARVPSLRRMSQLHGVSIGTVVQAYGLLEDRGIVRARPQSGYYVCEQAETVLAMPTQPDTLAAPANVALGDLAMQVVRANSRAGLAQLGVAHPSNEFSACAQVMRRLARCARRYAPEISGYEVPPGNVDLRRQVARRAMAQGYHINPDELVITSGCQEALTLCLQTVARRGDTIAVETPLFYGTLQLIEALGLKVIEIPTHPQTGISLPALQQALAQWPMKACLLSAVVNNPMGFCMPEAHKRQLISLLETHDLPLIEDDVFGELCYDSPRLKPLKAYDRDGRVLWCSSVSKTLDPGLRVGWVAPGRYAQQVSYLKFVTTMAGATQPQAAVAEFLGQGGYDRHLRQARTHYQCRRDRMINWVGRYFPAGTRVTRPQGGFLLWLELPEATDAVALYRTALDAGISTAPGTLFSATGQYRHCLRLNFAMAHQDWCEQAVRRLGQLAAQAVVTESETV